MNCVEFYLRSQFVYGKHPVGVANKLLITNLGIFKRRLMDKPQNIGENFSVHCSSYSCHLCAMLCVGVTASTLLRCSTIHATQYGFD